MARTLAAESLKRSPVAPDVDGASFGGFAPPTSNTTYVPNQFFDVCLPHYPRGVVRLVAYMIRATLGWCDANGDPREERRVVSYRELQHVGIARGMIRKSLDEALAGHFIRCLREPRPSRSGKSSVSGLYELRWDERPEYVKDPIQFRGFFAGEGNRTYIPNQFLDRLVPRESLAVLKVVGSVVRLSIGFRNKWGHRRLNVALSYQHIQNYSRLKDRSSLSDALRHALAANYIERVEEGFFDRDGGKRSKAAVYALRWLNAGPEQETGSKTRPAENERKNQSENQTGTGSKTRPADRFENQTDIEIKQENKTLKQQDAAAFELLKGEGFDAKAAQAIALQYPAERVERQIRWLHRRQIKSNRLGLLRAAIEGDWPAPGTQLGAPNSTRQERADFATALIEARRRLLGPGN